jgi:hypothetical protein
MISDVDLVYDYYTGVNLAAGGYATMCCRVKDDKLEDLFRRMTIQAMDEARAASGLVIKLGGRIY